MTPPPDSTTANAPDDPVTVEEYRIRAKGRLPAPVWNYYTTGADQERTLAWNAAAFDRLVLRPRVLRAVHDIDTSAVVFGKRYALPLAIAPSAYQRLAGGLGEPDTYRAARRLGAGFVLSTNANTSLEDVVTSAAGLAPPPLPPPPPPPPPPPGSSPEGQPPGPWFQLYCLGDRSVARDLIRRAGAAGYEALVLTVDAPVTGNRLHERRSPLRLPPGLTRANVGAGASRGRLLLNARSAADARRLYEENRAQLTDASLTWDEAVPWIRAQMNTAGTAATTKMKLIVKGIMTAEDAALAVEAGVDAVVVSNHGGRQLDGVAATLEVLPEVVDAVAGRVPVILDGGISRGSDVFKAMALGADLCLIGRSALWGLACDSQRGVESVLHILERELSRTMALMGVSKLVDISRDMLGVRKVDGFGISKL